MAPINRRSTGGEFARAQRRALWARDRGCRFPGCGAPWTHAHHVVPWQQGSPTNLGSAVLVCGIHHRRVHEDGWRVEVVDAVRGTNGPVDFVDPGGGRRVSESASARWPVPIHLLRDPTVAGARAP